MMDIGQRNPEKNSRIRLSVTPKVQIPFDKYINVSKYRTNENTIVPFDVLQIYRILVIVLLSIQGQWWPLSRPFCFGTNFKRPIRICTKLKQSCWQAKKYLPDAIFFTLYYYNNEGIALESSQLSV